MSKATYDLTDTPQQIAIGAAIFTVNAASAGASITFMTAADDENPLRFQVKAGDQFTQYDAELTFAKCSGEVSVIVDGEIL